MARTPVVKMDVEQRNTQGFLQVIDTGARSLLTEIVKLLRINNRHLEEMTGNTLNEEDFTGSQFGNE